MNRKCYESALIDTKLASASTRNNTACICSLDIKDGSLCRALEAHANAATKFTCSTLGSAARFRRFSSWASSDRLAISIVEVTNFLPNHLYALILLGDLLYGLCGGWFGFEATCCSYVAHQTSINETQTSEESVPILRDNVAVDNDPTSNEAQTNKTVLLRNVRLAILVAFTVLALASAFS